MDYSPLGSSVHGISHARIFEWVAISFSKGSSWLRDWTHVSCLAGRFFMTEPPGKPRESTLLQFKKKKEETPECLSFLWVVWRHSQKVAVHRPWGERSPELNHVGTVSLDFRLQNWEKLFCCLSHPVCVILLWSPEEMPHKKWDNTVKYMYFFL